MSEGRDISPIAKATAPAKRAFISYAREDGAIALKVYGDLKRADANPWLDVVDLLPGQRWSVAITAAIQASSHFLALLSAHSITKQGFIQDELEQAFDVLAQVPPHQIYLIPVRLDGTPPNRPELAELHWADLSASYDQGIQKIIHAICQQDHLPGGEHSVRLQGRSHILGAISNLLSSPQRKLESMRFISRWNEASASPARRALRAVNSPLKFELQGVDL